MALLILPLFVAVFWVILILPRQRELKRHQALMGELAVDQEVMMTSGIYGVIREIDGEYVQLEIADGMQIKIAKRSVAARVEEPVAVEGATTDSVPGTGIGQTPVSEAESEPVQGDDGEGAVIDLDDEVDSARGNEA